MVIKNLNSTWYIILRDIYRGVCVCIYTYIYKKRALSLCYILILEMKKIQFNSWSKEETPRSSYLMVI